MGTVQKYTTGWKAEQEFAYSRAIRAGNLVFVSGSTGFDYESNTLPEDPAEQVRHALANIDMAMRKLGSSLGDLVMITTYYTSDDDWPAIGAVLGEVLANIRPTNSAIRSGLVAKEMKVEISAVGVVDED